MRGGMSAMRWLLWCAVLLAWPADLIVRMAWGAPWATGLTDWLAPAAVLLGVGLLVTARAEAPRLRDWRRKREIRDLRDDVAELQHWRGIQEAAMAETRALRESGLEGVRRALDSAGVEIPDCVSADAPTQPVLRAIPGRRAV